MLQYRLQREDYWMKTFSTVYYEGPSERTKFRNKGFRKGNYSHLCQDMVNTLLTTEHGLK